jgi:hypothetical protein
MSMLESKNSHLYFNIFTVKQAQSMNNFSMIATEVKGENEMFLFVIFPYK